MTYVIGPPSDYLSDMPDSRDIDLLQAAIDASGLSASAFARDKLVRDPRTLRRWRAGQPLPKAVRVHLRTIVAPEVVAAIDAAPADPVASRPGPDLGTDSVQTLEGLLDPQQFGDRSAGDLERLARELVARGWLPPGGDDE